MIRQLKINIGRIFFFSSRRRNTMCGRDWSSDVCSSDLQGARILQHAWESRYASDLMASLPIIAMDGTMARRLRNTGMDGEGRIKTGTLADVRSIAGFRSEERRVGKECRTTWTLDADK